MKNSRTVHSPQSWKGGNNKKSRTSQGSTSRKKLLIKITIWVIVIGGIIGTLGVFGLFVWASNDLPSPDKLQERVLAESTKIFDRSGEHLLYEIHGDTKRTLVKLEDIPQYTIDAFVSVEDQQFYNHQGFNLWGIARAVITNIVTDKTVGGSTLTQQFVKNAILTREKTYTRKIKEVILAYQIENTYNKEEILQLYFNEIPFGSTAYGIESAAQTYFAKSAKDLSLAESAALAGMVQAPTRYSPYGNNVDQLINRQQFVLAQMLSENYITQEQHDEALTEELVFDRQLENIQAPHFVLYVKELLVERYGERTVEQGGLNVITSLDYEKQQAAETAVTNQAEKNLEDHEASNAALVSVDPKTGEVLAMVGSKDFFDTDIDGQVNVALRPRQPGSSFKPLVYLAAFSKGFIPESIIFDVKTTFKTDSGKDYAPNNYDLKDLGPITLRTSLQLSRNISAVKLLYLVGVSDLLNMAESFGYTTLSDRSRFGLSLVLGGGEVSLFEHVYTYATFAREGERAEPVSILKVTDTEGRVWEEWTEPTITRVIEAEPVRLLNNVLTDDAARSSVFGSNGLLTLPGRPVAAKTGTTNDYRDAWTVGYTPSIATGVWVGNNDNSTMKRGSGGYTVAAPIWNEYMRAVLADTLVETFREPTIPEIDKPMIGGSIGQEQTLRIDTISQRLATEHTPPDLIEEKTFRKLHSILHFVDRNDPLGPIPQNPEQDPQYNNWEAGIITWAAANDIEVNEQPPTEYDNIHLPNQQPKLTFTSPQPNQLISGSVPISLSWETSFDFRQLDIYVDDILLYTTTSKPSQPFVLGLALDPEQFLAGTHSVKAVIYDEAQNSKLDFVLFSTE